MVSLTQVWIWVGALAGALWALVEVRFLVAHIGLNLVVALAAAIRTGEFRFYRVGEFLYKKLLPFVLVYAAARGIGIAANQGWLAVTVLVLIEATLASDLIENLERLGVPIPDGLMALVSKAE